LVRKFPHGVSFVQIQREENKVADQEAKKGSAESASGKELIGCRDC
jgi:hypothetical protein